MPRPPDDLPRSPTGRVPQWVIDEAAGKTPDSTPWRAETAPASGVPRRARRRHVGPVVVSMVLALLVGGAWYLGGAPGLPIGLTSAVGSILAPAPSAQVVALADEAHLSATGRELFYAARPQVLDAAQFASRCTAGSFGRTLTAGSTVGCFMEQGGGTSIIVYQPTDPRLRGFVVETAAHETLHAAWARLSATDRARLTPLLERALAPLPADDPIREEIAASVGQHPDHRPTELFAYLGTQVPPSAGLDPALEAAYSRFIADRAALVTVATGWQTTLDQLSTAAQTAAQALADHQRANAQQQAQYAAITDSVDYYRDALAAKTAEVAAMPADQRARLRLSWVWWDGTTLPMAPAEQTLRTARTLLARDEASLAAQQASISTSTAAIDAERSQVDALNRDLTALQAQLDPSTASA